MMNLRISLLASLAMCFVAMSAGAGSPKQAAIASADPRATEAGMEILRQGGNAFDAAVAVTAALGVVEPAGSGLGGGGFFLLYDAQEESYRFIDAREKAPSLATRDMFLDASGNPVAGASRDGPLQPVYRVRRRDLSSFPRNWESCLWQPA